tara:strand:+ start:355 stop:714 length:360 start_codon:yes stop_codon:yes gene_type:complete
MNRTLILFAASFAALAAHAQYARPGTIVPPPAPAARPAAPAAQAPAAQPAARGTVVPEAPFCFEAIDQRDTALISALNANGLLCPTVAKTGAPVRLRATPAGELTGEETGAPTALHRMR